MEATLNLTKIIGYELTASSNEWGTDNINKGVYKSESLADLYAKGVGYWGSDGSVERVELYIDGKSLFNVISIGNFVDVSRDQTKEMNESIKSKLSDSELKFLGLK